MAMIACRAIAQSRRPRVLWLITMQSIRLVPSTQDDIDFVVFAEHDRRIAPFIMPWNRSRHVAALAEPDLSHQCVWVDRRIAGFVLLAGLLSCNRSIELRRLVVTLQGRGIRRHVIRCLKQQAFAQLNAHRLCST